MLVLGLGINFLSYNISSIDFRYRDFLVSKKPSSDAMLLGFGFYGTYSFKESPLFLGLDLNFNSGNLNTSWDVYGFEYENTTNVSITKVKFLIGLYTVSKSYIFQAGFAPQIWSLELTGDNGYSNGSNLGFGFFGDILFPITSQIFISIGAFYDNVPSITTTFSENNNLKVTPNTNQTIGFRLNFAFSLQ